MRISAWLLVGVLSSGHASAQGTNIGALPTLPLACQIGAVQLRTSDTTLWACGATDTWTQLGWAGGGSGLPSGAIIFVSSGTCPASYTEVAGLNGRMVRGTVAANGDVGTTGGSDSYTPAGTISPLTFVGAALATHTHTFTGTVNTLAVTAHTVVATKQGTAAGNVVTTATHAITGIPGGSNAAITAGTPAGTIATPTFTGSQASVVPAYLNLIACSKT